jgi:hypothetical protein
LGAFSFNGRLNFSGVTRQGAFQRPERLTWQVSQALPNPHKFYKKTMNSDMLQVGSLETFLISVTSICVPALEHGK